MFFLFKNKNKYLIASSVGGLLLYSTIKYNNNFNISCYCSCESNRENKQTTGNIIEREKDLINNFNPSKDIYKIKKSSNLTLYFDCKTRNPRYVIEHLRSSDSTSTSSSTSSSSSIVNNKRPSFYIENIIDSDFMVLQILYFLLTHNKTLILFFIAK